MPRQVTEVTSQDPAVSGMYYDNSPRVWLANSTLAQAKRILDIKDDIDQLSLNPATVQEPGPYAKA